MPQPSRSSPLPAAASNPGSTARRERCTAILRCPISRSGLRTLQSREVIAINHAIEQGKWRHAGGEPIQELLEAGLCSEDNRFVYPIRSGVWVLLPHLAIVEQDTCRKIESLCPEKQIVQQYYEEFGWRRGKGERFGEVRWEDERTIVKSYISKCNRRVRRFLPRKGEFLLDAASGALPHPEYCEYSEGFDTRICVDFSWRALLEAKEKLGQKGIYLLADVTNLPLRDGSVDAAVSLHTIYHVPADQQVEAFRELFRVIKPNAKAVVVYSWGAHCALMRWADLVHARVGSAVRQLGRVLRKLGRFRAEFKSASERSSEHGETRPLYYRPLERKAFTPAKLGFSMDVRAFSSIDADFTRRFVGKGWFSRGLLGALFQLENWFPRTLGRLGQYPLFVIRK